MIEGARWPKRCCYDELWQEIEPLLPAPKPRRYRYPGRKPIGNRQALTGIPWELLPQEMGCGSGMSCWRRLRDWQEAGVWQRIHEHLLARLQEAAEIDWSRAVVDSALLRAVHGGERTSPNLTEAQRHDVTQLLPLVYAIAPAPAASPGSGARGSRLRLRAASRGAARAVSVRCWRGATPNTAAVWACIAGWWNASCVDASVSNNLLHVLEKYKLDKKVIMHIGLPKTASTSFQLILGENRLRLRRQGFEYFLGRINLGYNHTELYLSVLRPDLFTFAHQRKSPILTPDLIEKTRERIKVFLGNSKLNNHVFSAEGLSFLRTEAELVRLKSMFPNDVIFKIIFVERDKNEWLESWKRQILSNPNRCLSTDPNSTMYQQFPP